MNKNVTVWVTVGTAHMPGRVNKRIIATSKTAYEAMLIAHETEAALQPHEEHLKGLGCSGIEIEVFPYTKQVQS